MKAKLSPWFGIPVLLFGWLAEVMAHHELADPADIFDKTDKPMISATPVQALLAALAILLIPLVIIALVFWSRRSKES